MAFTNYCTNWLCLNNESTADKKPFTLVADDADLFVSARVRVLEHRHADDVAGSAACLAQGLFGGYKHVGYILDMAWSTFSSHTIGRCSTISRGVASAAMTISSVMPRLRVLVDSLAPFLICLRAAHWAIRSLIWLESSSVAKGWALSEGSWMRKWVPLIVLIVD